MITSPSFIDKIKTFAEKNFCKNCYHKYLASIHVEIECLLSEPLSDWRETEVNIDLMWIKAKGLYKIVNSTVFSPNKKAFQKAKDEKLWEKLLLLKENGILKNFTHKFLDQVSKIRNKIHPPYKFSKTDYILFEEARTLTDAIRGPILSDLNDDLHEKLLSDVENRAKYLLSKLNLLAS